MNDSQPSVPYGLCHCGCGERTKIANHTDHRYGSVLGEPRRYLKGHHRRGPDKPLRYIERDCGYDTPCWVWQLNKTPSGHGLVGRLGRQMPAHRAYYEDLVGPIPEGHELHHLCENPPCVNPSHLQPLDRTAHRRLRRDTKLTLELAREIRTRRAEGWSYPELAEEYGLSLGTVWPIVQGLIWRE